jgi:hypothetical protein
MTAVLLLLGVVGGYALVRWLWAKHTAARVADLPRVDALRLLLGKDATRREGR